MIPATRATREADKLERRRAILDAVERLLTRHGDGFSTMDSLAGAAGVAKGTLYLYFAGKEEVLLGLHERHCQSFFDTLQARLDADRHFTLEDLLALTRNFIGRQPAFLPVGSLCCGPLQESLPREVANAFHAQLGERLSRAGARLDRVLALPRGEGARLLQHSYALIMGLWQLTGTHEATRANAQSAVLLTDYAHEIERALSALWTGAQALAARRKAARARRKP